MILFAGCTKDRRTNENPAGSAATNTVKTVEPKISMREYFPPDGSKGHFKGEGNEFAEFDIEVTQPHKDYFVIFDTMEVRISTISTKLIWINRYLSI